MPDLSPEQELERVMLEIAEALGSHAAALSLHPADRPAQVLYSGGDPALGAVLPPLIRSGALDWEQEHADHHVWVAGEFDPYAPHAIAIPVRRVPGHSRLVVTGFFRTLDEERRAAAQAAYMRRRPFAVGYFRLWQEERLRRREVLALRSALDGVDVATILIARSGAVAFANLAGRRLLDAATGLYLQNGFLRARSRADSTALAIAIDELIGADDHDHPAPRRDTLLTVRRTGASPLVVAALALPRPATEEGEVAAMLFVVDRDMDIRDFAVPVCRLFGLTRVETELACALALGRTIQEAASLLGIQNETARGYLKAVFAKTEVNRQVDLVRLILMSLVRASDGG